MTTVKKEVKRKKYMFTFEEGGWNTVYAKTKRGAIKEAIKEWKDYDDLNPRIDSVHLATEEGEFVAMSNFW